MRIICLLFFAIVLITSCKKEEEKQYQITLTVNGIGNFNYQIGNDKYSSHCNSLRTFTGTLIAGQKAFIQANGDTILGVKNGMTIELKSNPVLNGHDLKQTSTSPYLEVTVK